MFVRNRTAFDVELAHGRLGDRGGIAALVLRSDYSVSSGVLRLSAEKALPSADIPGTWKQALWAGTSVTVAGDVLGPATAPFQRPLSIAVGSAAIRLWAFGDRRWIRDSLGSLRPSAPLPFQRLTLSFERAYGGYFDVAPGLYPGTELPFPGGRFAYPLNHLGVGFYPDQASAEGRPLPNFELAEQVIQQWSDRPTPGCLAPCPELGALRAVSSESLGPTQRDDRWDALSRDGMLARMLRGHHPAPGYLVFDEIHPGTTIRVDGVGDAPIAFSAPPPPARVRVRRGKREERISGELRHLHVDARRAIVRCVVGYPFMYREGDEPSWIIVEDLALGGAA